MKKHNEKKKKSYIPLTNLLNNKIHSYFSFLNKKYIHYVCNILEC
ncbi:hypothetical protein C9I82_398 [Candidatus Purcelliella pentastirinorum]|uniref:Uncharacterized protein n=1 Tax=Candidatus Purcelliella pentastirinorum TaxID=472834 RepID=A0A346E048_9ENTR|nr:hypothetical protein C9I82_398 [Candidatus Purcelliella pentastirinorum]